MPNESPETTPTSPSKSKTSRPLSAEEMIAEFNQLKASGQLGQPRLTPREQLPQDFQDYLNDPQILLVPKDSPRWRRLLEQLTAEDQPEKPEPD